MQTPPHPNPLEVVLIVMNRMKNHILDLSDFYFLSYGQFCTEISAKIANLEYKKDQISKTK